MKKRLSKTLAAAGVASRRAAEEIIQSGRVKVNGKICLVPQEMVDISQDDIRVDGKKVDQEEAKKYYILHKPRGLVCTANPKFAPKRVLDLFKDEGLRLFTVGRLDKETSGLIIITNDGHFANRIIHPSSEVIKEYLVKVDKEILHDHLVQLSEGIVIDGVRVKPKKVTKVRKATMKIAVGEGKNREVRSLCEACNLEVKELVRIRIGNLHLHHLPYGEYREMTEKEKELPFE